MDEARRELIKTLEEKRSSRIITYITSDRAPFVAQIAPDVLPLFYKALKAIGKVNKISIFLYSTGGNLDAPWPLMNLIREYCTEVEMLIPFRALSAATLFSLGANKIIMTPLSELSPIDPEGTFITEGKQQNYSVEDVVSFIDFAKDKIGIAESQPLSEVLRLLASEIKPSIMGSLNRTHARIRRLARHMLQLHWSEPKHETAIAEVVNNLTQLLGAHNHLIHRQEAREALGFGDMIENADPETETLIENVFESYSAELELSTPFDPKKLLTGNETEKDIVVKQACVESVDISYSFENPLKIQFIPQNNQLSVQPRGVPGWQVR